MPYLTVTPPQQILLTTLARVRADLGLSASDPALDAYLSAKIEQASSAIASELDRPILRQRVRERFGGVGRTTIALEVTPVVAIEALDHDLDGSVDLALGDVVLENGEAGIVRHRWTWPTDAPRVMGLTIDRIAAAGETPWTLTYVGGWLSAADDISASGVSALGRRLTMPAGAIAPLLASGEQIVAAGFSQPSNNRRMIVTGRTESTIDVAVDLQAETAGPGATIEVRNLPGALERLAMDAIRSWYYARKRDPSIRSERIGDWSATYGKAAEDQDEALPGTVLKGLDRFRRLM